MTNEHNNEQTPPDHEGVESRNLGRRGFAKATLVAPVVLSVATRPAWGNETCTISGLISGNLSRPGDTTPCEGDGCTPGFWKNQYLPWEDTGYSPGWLTCSDTSKSVYACSSPASLQILLTSDPLNPTGWGHKADTWGTMFGCAPPGASGYSIDTPLITILQAEKPLSPEKAFAKHAVAAILNASNSAVQYGSNPEDLKVAICAISGGGSFAGRTMEQFKDWLVGLNERGCPLDADESVDNPVVTIDGKTYKTMRRDSAYIPVIDE